METSASRALLSRAETARLLGVSTLTLDRLTRARRGPRRVRIGRRVLFRAAAVERWIGRVHTVGVDRSPGWRVPTTRPQ